MRLGKVISLAITVLAISRAALAQDLPYVPFAFPEPALLGETDPVLGPARARVEDAFAVWRNALGSVAARSTLAATLAREDAVVAASVPEFGRRRAAWLSMTLPATSAVHGPDAAMERALLAVAIERQLATNAIVFGTFLPDSTETSITGLATDVRASAIGFALDEAAAATVAGDIDKAQELAGHAFAWAQTLAQSPAARGSVRQARLQSNDPLSPATERVRAMTGLVARTALLEQVVARGLLNPYPADLQSATQSLTLNRDLIAAEVAAAIQADVSIADAVLPRPLSVAAVADLLGPKDAVVLIVPDDVTFTVFAVTDTVFAWHRSQSDWPTLDRQMRRLLSGISGAQTRGAMRLGEDLYSRDTHEGREMTEAAYALYQQLLAPLDQIIAHKPRLMVATTGRATRFPFQMLLTRPARSGENYAAMDWLVRRHAIVMVPALESLVLSGGVTDADDDGLHYLGLGAPDYQLGRGTWADAVAGAAIPRLPPLPEAAAEVEAVGALYPRERRLVLTGRLASEAAITALDKIGALARYDIIHLATHGLIFGDDPDISDGVVALAASPVPPRGLLTTAESLQLPRPDGALSEPEIRQMTLRARLVILSACNTLAAVEAPYDGLVTLAAAFLEAGAARVMASHWPVRSEAAVEIVTTMLTHDPELSDPAVALQHALLDQIAQGGRRADPSWWAPFSLIGLP